MAAGASRRRSPKWGPLARLSVLGPAILRDFSVRKQSNQSVLLRPLLSEAVMHKINIAEKFAKISEYYKPHIAGELNGQMVKLVKANAEFVWHHHENEDEMFLVVKGRFRMEFREKWIGDQGSRERHEWIEQGEFIIVPRGVEHRPVAEEDVWIMLFEPASTRNTGNVVNERTQPHLEHV
jgi:mannose-6-phosphate isomerase-like protein (cupin superfamily)